MAKANPRTTLTLHDGGETVEVDRFPQGAPHPNPPWIRMLAQGGRVFAFLTPREARHLARVLEAYADDLDDDMEDLNAR